MRASSHRSSVKHAQAVGAVAAVLLVAAACGSTDKTGSFTAGGSGSKPGGTVVETHSGPMGTYLTDSAGKSLYMFASDSPSKSTCTGSCVTYWPPFTTKGNPTASGAAKASDLGTLKRSDGTTQVTYDGHPLYYFGLDKSAGDTLGEGSTGFGAKWWLLAPSGKPITNATGAAPTTSSGSGSGGGWS